MISAEETQVQLKDGAFTATQWTQILLAAETSSPDGQEALQQLCQTYWYPLYAYVRRKGHSPEAAQDLTQAFFARLLDKKYLAHAAPELGKFRTFLLSSLQRFLINEWEKVRTQKRGGGASFVNWDAETEQLYQTEQSSGKSPEELYDKRWALTLLDQVFLKLQAEFAAQGQSSRFAKLKVLLWGDKSAPPYSEVAAQLGMTEGNLKVALHRLRRRYRELLREEVLRTSAQPEDVDEEIRYLIAVISGG